MAPAAVEALLEELGTRDYSWAAAWALVRVTGVDSAPFVALDAADPGERARSLDFWTRWWAENATSFRPVAEDVGAEALRRWRDRGGG